MTDFTNDAPVAAFMNGKYAQAPDGETPRYVRQPSLNVSSALDLGVASIDNIVGIDVGGTSEPRHIIQRTTVTASGVETIAYYETDGVTPVAQNGTFTPQQLNTESDEVQMFATNIDELDADYGLIYSVTRYMTKTDGVPDPSTTTFFDNIPAVPVDVTALVSAAPYSLDVRPQRVLWDNILFPVTGIVGVPIPAPPANAGSVRVYSEDANFRYTIDGTDPTDNNGLPMNMASPLYLERDEIAAFRAVPADGNGVVDGALTANLIAEPANIAMDED